MKANRTDDKKAQNGLVPEHVDVASWCWGFTRHLCREQEEREDFGGDKDGARGRDEPDHRVEDHDHDKSKGVASFPGSSVRDRIPTRVGRLLAERCIDQAGRRP